MDDNELEHVLDRALASRTAVELPAGIEKRVMRRIVRARIRRFLMITVPAPVLACAAMLAIRLAPDPVEPPALVRVVPGAPPVQVENYRRPEPHRAQVRPQPLKPRQFPTPSPVTPQERALLALVASNPQQVVHQFADLRRRMDQPLVVTPLEMTPLEDQSQKETYP